MASNADGVRGRDGKRWRTIAWGLAVALLVLPFVAMQFQTGVNWSPGDFIVFGMMIAAVGGGFELAVRASGSWAYRGGTALALAASFLTVWANLAVGIVGDEHNPANLLFFAALLIGLVGSIGTQFRARGMAASTLATATALLVAFGLAMIDRPDESGVNPGMELAGTGIFVALFLGSSALFAKAARASGR